VLADAALHSFDTAYTWSAGIFAGGAVLTGVLFRRLADRRARAAAAPTAVVAAEAAVVAH